MDESGRGETGKEGVEEGVTANVGIVVGGMVEAGSETEEGGGTKGDGAEVDYGAGKEDDDDYERSWNLGAHGRETAIETKGSILW